MALTDGAWLDVAIEAVGIPDTFDMALRPVRPGGNVASIGVHGKSVELRLQDLRIRILNISMGLVNTNPKMPSRDRHQDPCSRAW